MAAVGVGVSEPLPFLRETDSKKNADALLDVLAVSGVLFTDDRLVMAERGDICSNVVATLVRVRFRTPEAEALNALNVFVSLVASVEKFEKKADKNADSVSEGVKDGVKESVTEGVNEGVREGDIEVEADWDCRLVAKPRSITALVGEVATIVEMAEPIVDR